MPRQSLKAVLSQPLAAAAGIALAVGALLAVLYVMFSGPVHALDRVPPALARLKPLENPKRAPDVAFADATGRLHLLDQFRGRYVLINLWAPWCTPCVRELPDLAGLKAAIPAARLTVLAVNVGRSDTAETAQFLAARHASALGVWRDSNIALLRAFRAYGLPTSVLIGPDGKVVARAAGTADWDAPTAIAYFNALPLLHGAKPAS